MSNKDILLGWSWDQWAIAAGETGSSPPISLHEAHELKKNWISVRPDPATGGLAGIVYKRDHAYPSQLFSLPFNL